MEKSWSIFVLNLFDYERDYELFASWWPELAPPKSSLPVNGVNINNKAMGFLANTDTDFAIITWYYANPLNTKKESYQSMKTLFIILTQLARDLNKKYAFCYTNKRGIIRLLESLNYKQIDHGHMAVELV